MDAQSIALVQSTFKSVMPIADQFSAAFYDHLFELDPSLRGLFATDLTAQRQKLIVEPHHYDLVLDAMMHAFELCIPAEMTPAAVVAWRRAYNLVAETMLYGAAHGASRK